MSGILTSLPGVMAAGGGGSPAPPDDTQTVTTGYMFFKGITQAGFSSTAFVGSISDGTFDLKGGVAITAFLWTSVGSTLNFSLAGTQTNAGWSELSVGTRTFRRVDATFSVVGGNTSWTWDSPNFFPANGVAIPVEFRA